MSYMLIKIVQERRDEDDIDQDWQNCNPLDLKYDTIPSPFLVLCMQLNPQEIGPDTKVEITYESVVDYLESFEMKEADAIDENRFQIHCRGIDSSIYACLSESEARALRELAFAEFSIENIQVDSERNNLESIIKLNNQQEENSIDSK